MTNISDLHPQDRAIGMVLGQEPATPLAFWFWIEPHASVQLDDLVVIHTYKPDGKLVTHYGIVDQVQKTHEGLSFESDVRDVQAGLLPASVSYSAHVLVTRVDPEDFIPPQPGDPVFMAQGDHLSKALYQERMEHKLPAGVLRNGQPVAVNFDFINGTSGAHINISGISGVATKTSYALFLLYSIFNSPTLSQSHQAKAVIFNVKGEDLLFLDHENSKFAEKEKRQCQDRNLEQDRYSVCGLPKQAFQSVQFLAPPKPRLQELYPDVEQRNTGVGVYLWSIREFCQKRLLSYCFSDRESSLNLGFLITHLEERLVHLSRGINLPYLLVNDWDDPEAEQDPEAPIDFDSMGNRQIRSFEQLIQYIEYKLIGCNDGEGDKRWVAKQNTGTLQAFLRRLRGVSAQLSPLIRGDIQHPEQHRIDILSAGFQLSVVDIHKLNPHAQMFVVGVTLKALFEEKERVGINPPVFVVLDELNKYAPREGDSPIKSVLLDIAERGRSLGIILIGAQQTASEVERRIVGNAAIRIVGRLDPAEAERPEYRFLPGAYRLRASILQPGTMIVQQPEVPTPVMVTFPFPYWATRQDESHAKAVRFDPETRQADPITQEVLDGLDF